MNHRHSDSLGSAHEGTGHFWQQRLSALANLLLGSVLLVSLTLHGRGDHATVFAWFAQPWMAGLTIAFIISATWHMRLGANAIIDDYIYTEGLRLFLHLLNMFFAFAVMFVGILAMLQILLGDVPQNNFFPNEISNHQAPQEPAELSPQQGGRP